MKIQWVFVAMVWGLLPLGLWAGESQGYNLTVYNNDLVLVGDERRLNVPAGTHPLFFSDIAGTLDATSVQVDCPSDPQGFKVQEQNYEYDLVNPQALLQKYIGQTITLLKFGGDKGEDLPVKLLSADGNQMVVQKDDGSLLNVYSGNNIQFPQLPEGLRLKPTLRWLVDAKSGGPKDLKLTYLASGMSWHSDYTLLVDEAKGTADFDGWVTVDNHTGTRFTDARLKLLAGEVNRAPGVPPRDMLYEAKAMDAAAPAPAFAEKAFGDYHLYTLSRTTTLENNETKQIGLLSAPAVPVQKLYRYDGAGLTDWWGNGITDRYYGNDSGVKKVDVFLKFANEKAAGLGEPLPAGKIRVYQKDDDGAQAFLGEDAVDHTPEGEDVTVRLGTAFDVVGERTQSDFVNPDNHTILESFTITVKNHKKRAVAVDVVEHLYRYANWKITVKSADFNQVDARTVDFPVTVPADGKTTVSYTVRYWRG
ncbi:MAG TPA: DUF4139 domain-containing protein [bacterium]|nr:DUF4139 domain-containing protein [bacterium]